MGGRFVPRWERQVGQRLARSVSLGDPVFEELEVERVSDFGVHQETLDAPAAGVLGARSEWLLGIQAGVGARVADIFEELLESTHESEVVLVCVRCDFSSRFGEYDGPTLIRSISNSLAMGNIAADTVVGILENVVGCFGSVDFLDG